MIGERLLMNCENNDESIEGYCVRKIAYKLVIA